MDALTHAAIGRLARRIEARQAADELPGPETRFAAVAAVLRVVDGPELLLIKRADVEHDPWSGHMALPGGRRETVDDSLQATAIRETREEVSLRIDPAQILGRLDDLAPRSRALPPIIVRPFVAVVSPDVVLTPSREVAEMFWVPLALLKAPESLVQHTVWSQGEARQFPGFALRGQVVWGLTERIIRQLLELADE